MQISERMWSLWPQIIQCFYEWAVDYFDHISGALENYICKGREHFLAGNHLQQVPSLTLHPHVQSFREASCLDLSLQACNLML